MARIAIATFGSGGDFFPLVPIAQRLRDAQHDVRFVVPRSLTLFTRMVGIRAFAFGDGRELRAFDDTALYTTRFGGWSSWSRTLNQYIAPTLEEDVDGIGAFLDSWSPDVVVATSFAVSARIAALSRGIPLQRFSIYPQHTALRQRSRESVPRDLMIQLRRIVPQGLRRTHRLCDLAWGCDGPGLLLHDCAVLGAYAPMEPDITVTGFPYWDALPVATEAVPMTIDWVERSQDPIVVITLGSFVGLRATQQWTAARDAVLGLGLRALMVGARSANVPDHPEGGERVLATGFLPLSRFLPYAAGAIHHGGVGTMFAVLGARLPAVVVPQAFDQSFSAELLRRAGVGDYGHELRGTLEAVLSSSTTRERAAELSDRLVPPAAAAARATEWITQSLMNSR